MGQFPISTGASRNPVIGFQRMVFKALFVKAGRLIGDGNWAPPLST